MFQPRFRQYETYEFEYEGERHTLVFKPIFPDLLDVVATVADENAGDWGIEALVLEVDGQDPRTIGGAFSWVVLFEARRYLMEKEKQMKESLRTWNQMHENFAENLTKMSEVYKRRLEAKGISVTRDETSGRLVFRRKEEDDEG